MAVELPSSSIDMLFRLGSGKGVEIETDFEKSQFIVRADGEEERINFTISDFDRRLVTAGGWLEYADTKY